MFYKSLDGISFLYVPAIREAVKEKMDFTELNMSFILEKMTWLATGSPPRQEGSGGESDQMPYVFQNVILGLGDLSLSGRLMLNRILELNVNSICKEKCNCFKNWNICICLTRPFSPHGQSLEEVKSQ